VNPSESILLVDDDARFRERLSRALGERCYRVLAARNHAEAMLLASAEPIERAVVDLRMPGPHGLEVVKGLREKQPDMRIVVLTGYGSIATAVEAVRLGAIDYLTKPCHTDQILYAFDGHGRGEPSEPSFEIPSLARLEREHIERVLTECGGNVSKTARVLGVHRRTLQYKLAKYPVTR
jgi:two-component system response regulator RegA